MSTSPATRLLAAACLVTTGLAMVTSAALTPSTGAHDRAAIDAFAAHSGRVNGALTADVFVLLLGAAIAVAALLVRPRFPKLAGTAGWLGIISGSAMIYLVSLDFALRAAAATDRGSSVKLLHELTSNPQFPAFLVLALLGGLVATVCLGVGLWRARAIPRWAAAALIAFQPANIATNGAGPIPFAAANALLLIGFAACAITILRNGLPDPAQQEPAPALASF
jgi:hypothetical protein